MSFSMAYSSAIANRHRMTVTEKLIQNYGTNLALLTRKAAGHLKVITDFTSRALLPSAPK